MNEPDRGGKCRARYVIFINLSLKPAWLCVAINIFSSLLVQILYVLFQFLFNVESSPAVDTRFRDFTGRVTWSSVT